MEFCRGSGASKYRSYRFDGVLTTRVALVDSSSSILSWPLRDAATFTSNAANGHYYWRQSGKKIQWRLMSCT
jgi:hypothetical protein